MDVTQNMSPENQQKLKLFVQQLISSFDLESGSVHIGIILYSKEAKVLFYLDQYQDLWSMLEAIDNINVNTAPASKASGKPAKLY